MIARSATKADSDGSDSPVMPSNSPMVEQAEKARTAFAHKRLKSSSVGGFRPDAMMYISGALQTFKMLGPQKRQAIAP